MSLNDEQEMVKELLAGNRKTLRRFYRTHYPRLLAYVKTRVKTSEDAEEIVQDAFLGMLESLPLFSMRSSLWTFLVSVAKHEVADYYRKLYAKKAIKYVPFVDQVYVEPLHSAEETREVFERVLNQLKGEERNLVLWKYEEGLSVGEIAERLGVGVKAAESRLFRARRAFQLAWVEIGE